MGRPYFFGGSRDFGGDGDVVHVYADERAKGVVFGNSSAVSVVHKGLESGGRIAEAKHHDSRLVEAAACFEGRFVCVGLLNANVIVALAHVEFRVESCSAQVANEVTNEG